MTQKKGNKQGRKGGQPESSGRNDLLLQRIQQMGRIGIWEYDLASRQITWSDEIYELYHRDRSLGPPTESEEAAYYSPHQATMLRSYADEVIHTGKEMGYDLEAILPDGSTAYFTTIIYPVKDHRGQVVKLTGTVQDITERTTTRLALEESENRFKSLFEEDLTGDFVASPDGTLRFCNKAFMRMGGFPTERKCRETNIRELFPSMMEARRFLVKIRQLKKLELHEQRMIRVDGKELFTVGNYTARFNDQGIVTEITGYVFDITDRKQAELRRELVTNILMILKRPNDWQALIHDILNRIREFSGMEAIGIRLKEGEDFPYFEISGFPDQFILKENLLCQVNSDGSMSRDAGGMPLLDCMCGRVITGRPVQEGDLFTRNGSFWTNDLQELACISGNAEEVLFPRGSCLQEGYRSQALIPLKGGKETIGLLQLNDHRPDRFTPDLIRFYEEIGATIGIAFSRMTQERKIREAEERFRTLFDNLVIGVYQTTPDGRILMVNPSLLGMLGFTSLEELRQRNLEQEGFEPGYERAEFKERIEQEGFVIGLESAWERADGQVIYVRESARCVRDGTGQVLYYEGTVEDISQQKRTEAALRDSEMQFRLLFENAPFPRWVYDMKTLAFLEVNKAAIQKYGYSRDEFLSMTLKDIRPLDEVPKLKENIATDQADIQFSRGWHHLTREGTRLDVEISSHATTFNGREARVVLAHDVTERKKYERDLHETKEYLQKLLDHANAPIVTLNPDLSVRATNQAVERLTGYSEEELKKIKFSQLLPEFFHSSMVKLVEKVVRGDQITDLEIPLLTREGTIRHTVWNIANIQSDSGVEMVSILAIGTDITERKHIYEALEQAHVKAEESNRLKTSLLNSLSHEFRTPMNAILGFSSLLEQDLPGSVHAKMASRINQAGNRLMKTLDDILELAQLRASITRENKETLQAGRELAEILPHYREAAGRKGVELLTSVGKEVLIPMRKIHFRLIIDHLLDNALKFTETGSVTITISGSQDDPAGRMNLTVADTGIGIAKEHQTLIFEEFRQVSEGYGRTYEGTGLGLAIVKRIVELYEGTITLESEPGKGSAFTCSIPAGSPHDPESLLAGERHRKEEEGKTAGSAPTGMNGLVPEVLVVEDNLDNVEVIRFFLGNLTRIDAVASAAEALEKVQHKQYDLLLMDIHLGAGKNGLDATREIRRMPAYEHIPIVAVTGYTTPEDKNLIFEAGCSHYLGKPFTKKQLMTLIGELVR